jgi:hypothetical protein
MVRSNTAFDPETHKVLGAAYDLAVASLNLAGQQPNSVYEVVATRLPELIGPCALGRVLFAAKGVLGEAWR